MSIPENQKEHVVRDINQPVPSEGRLLDFSVIGFAVQQNQAQRRS